MYPINDLCLSEIAHEIKYEQDDEHKTKSAAAADMPPVCISATAEEKNKNENKENKGHNSILY